MELRWLWWRKCTDLRLGDVGERSFDSHMFDGLLGDYCRLENIKEGGIEQMSLIALVAQ